MAEWYVVIKPSGVDNVTIFYSGPSKVDATTALSAAQASKKSNKDVVLLPVAQALVEVFNWGYAAHEEDVENGMIP